MFMQLLDQKLAAFITGMRLAGEHDLEWKFARNVLQALRIGEQKIRALVGRHATRETENRHVRQQYHTGQRLHFFDQPLLCLNMRLPDRIIGNAAVGAHQQLGLVTPARRVMVINLAKSFCGPGIRMHAVADRVYTIAGEHRIRHLGMSSGDTVDVFAQVQRQARHVQAVLACQMPDGFNVEAVVEHAPDQIVGKPVMPRLDRGVGGEAAHLANPVKIIIRLTRPQILGQVGITPHQIQSQQGGVPFVHVVMTYRETERLQKASATQTQHDFLPEPVDVVTAV